MAQRLKARTVQMHVIFTTLLLLILLGAEVQMILKWFLGKDGNFNSIHYVIH